MGHGDYTVGWICALPTELAAADAMLDERHNPLPRKFTDDNNYTLGRIGGHNVAITCLPSGVTGIASAAIVASRIRSTFPSFEFGLMVGVGGGAPSTENDIRLGDVVISKPAGKSGGVIQYDFGKTVQEGRFVQTGSLNRPPDVVLHAVSSLQARHMKEDAELPSHLSQMLSKYPKMQKDYAYQGPQQDHLFQADYDHRPGDATCVDCEPDRLITRVDREDKTPTTHYGLIASGNQVMRDGVTRERLRQEHNVLCFEMEAAGLMDDFPCLVIRGICDYADSHKNKQWQGYAAAAAAAYAKELLCIIPGNAVAVAHAQAVTAIATKMFKPLFSVPFQEDHEFIDRKDIFSQIEAQLQIHHRASLCGMGGVGKSQIAIEYAYRFRRSHPQSHVFWVYAMSSGTFVQAYHDIARKLQLPACDDPNTDVCELVSKWLDEEDGHWLMIVDNADKADLFFSSAESDITPATVTGTQRPLIDYLPKIMNSQKSLLITTRSGPVGQDLADGEPGVKVPPFSSQEATELLRLKTKRAVDPFDKHSTERLLDVLGCIPLAITQAAAFMSRNRMTIQSYLADLERNKNLADYLSHELRDHRRPGGFPNSVFRTWKLSFDQILTQEPETAKLLSLIAMLDPQRIPEKLLRPLTERDVDFRTAIGTLSGFALISQDIVGETYSIHPLVQASLHYWLEQSGQKADVAGQALLLLAKEFPAGDYEHKETCELMLAHAQAVLCHECTSDNDIIHRADLLYNVGCFSLEQGRYFSAYREASEAYSIYRTNMGGAANNTLASLSLLASVFESRGNYNEAEKMNRRALKGYEKVLGIEHPDTLTSVNNLAWVLESQGNYNEAEKMNRRALKEREKVLGIEHPDTLISVSNLASVLRYQGNYNEAEKMNRRALKEREKVLGIEHPDTLISVSNLASIFTSQGKYNEAEEMNRRALKAREKVLGIEHPHTLSNFSDLASVLESQRKYNEAEEMNRRALKGYEKVLGIEHPHTLTTVYNFAFLFHTQQRYKDASVLYLRASAGFLKTLGPDHPLTRRCSQKYSDMLCEMEHDNMSDGPNVSSMAKRARQGSQVRDQADREGQGQRRSFAGQLAASKGNDLTEDSTGDGGSERDGKGGSKESNPASTE